MAQVPQAKRHPYDQWSPDARALDLVGDKWTLLIVRDLAAGPRRFVELQRVLPGISTEQLRSRLNRMVADGMLTRKRYREVPPRVDYELTERARDLLPVLAALARWGFQWAWSAPRASERIDVGAIIRLAPGLLESGEVNGTIELRITDGGRDGGECMFTLSLDGEDATLVERSAESAQTRISADTAGWIAAFSPEGDRSWLEIDGERALGELVLDSLSLGAAPSATLAAPASGASVASPESLDRGRSAA